MKLSQILRAAQIDPAKVQGDAEVTGIQLDSRKIKPGNLFVCMPGMTNDPHSFIPAAMEHGAAAVLVHDPAALEGRVGALVGPEDFREAIWRICDAFFEHPTRNMKVVGVTGTNGKTTTAWLIRDMLKALGLRAGYLGTLGFHLPDEERELSNTTPFAVELYNLLAEAREKGVEALAMEVSSHALKERRADGVEFDAAVFTNLTQDHLDYHGTMEDYEQSKLRLFTELPKQTQKKFVGALNVGDPAGDRLARSLMSSRNLVRYALVEKIGTKIDTQLELAGVATWVKLDSICLQLASNEYGNYGVSAFLGGSYNVENLLSATAGMLALGYHTLDIERVGGEVRPVPGRFEPVPNEKGIGILVDYAHTPDALEKLLDAVRPLTEGRVITVFGCGGDRDRTKRPKMARAASERSDVTVVTSDNPRTEDPQAILNDILPGIAPGSESVAIIDRREAVSYAVKLAQPGDVVVIAGKGHENYQIIGRTKHHMDDRELAKEALE
ncbi:MAG TPA: UDP-N-acetylmuramoyl-L-alanyl-D-glutamate--2,6-diaminopimelate ligase [Fimbriimonas sp.]